MGHSSSVSTTDTCSNLVFLCCFSNVFMFQSMCRDEIMNLKSEKPEVGEYREVAHTTTDTVHVANLQFMQDSSSDEKKLDTGRFIDMAKSTTLPDSFSMIRDDDTLHNGSDSSKNIETTLENYQECFSDEIPSLEDTNTESNLLDELDEEQSSDILNEQVGENAVELFQQLLHINSSSSSEKGVVHFEPRSVTHNGNNSQEVTLSEVHLGTTEVAVAVTTPDRDSSDGRSVFQPTLVINGKQVCSFVF